MTSSGVCGDRGIFAHDSSLAHTKKVVYCRSLECLFMVTRSHLQLVQTAAEPLASARGRLLASVARQPELVERALDMAEATYDKRTLPAGEALLEHALNVAQTVAELNLDSDAIAAALLFQAHEQSIDSARAIREKFGPVVADLCEGVARMAQIGALSQREQPSQKPQQQAAQLEALRKMLLAMVQDVRVVLIKLADHLQTLRSASARRGAAAAPRGRADARYLRPARQPSRRLALKWELEDLAFRILEPETYKTIAQLARREAARSRALHRER